uniref:Type II toxin-antitoxin system HicB family antitoxin n=1 Tax=Desulfacinum infernum TaxID=35837 RepID=A0A832A245_9BACT
MKGELTAIIEPAPEGGYWAVCPEIPGANGQGETIEEAKENLRQAIELILQDRKEDFLRGLPDHAILDKVVVSCGTLGSNLDLCHSDTSSIF